MWTAREWQRQMGSYALVSRLLRALQATGLAVVDALPPYRWVEGPLVGKEVDAWRRYLILVGTTKLQVDELTFETLRIGESLRVRATRDLKAINIDRLSFRPDRRP